MLFQPNRSSLYPFNIAGVGENSLWCSYLIRHKTHKKNSKSFERANPQSFVEGYNRTSIIFLTSEFFKIVKNSLADFPAYPIVYNFIIKLYFTSYKSISSSEYGILTILKSLKSKPESISMYVFTSIFQSNFVPLPAAVCFCFS